LLFAAVLGCSVVLPYGVLLRTAFVRNWSGPTSLDNLSFEHWRFVFLEFSQTRLAFENTFVVSAAAATAGTILVTVVGYMSLRRLVWGHRFMAFLATSPVAIPGIVLAVGLFLTYTRQPFVLYGTLAIIFLAYVTKEMPVGYQQVSAALKSVHPELEDAGRIFGASRLRTLADITAPLIRNGVVATWIFIFIGSVRELWRRSAVHRAHQDHIGDDVHAREQRLGADRRALRHHAGDHLRAGRRHHHYRPSWHEDQATTAVLGLMLGDATASARSNARSARRTAARCGPTVVVGDARHLAGAGTPAWLNCPPTGRRSTGRGQVPLIVPTRIVRSRGAVSPRRGASPKRSH
jgi:ABC-type spermidine/putrescine transport system permease subunit II